MYKAKDKKIYQQLINTVRSGFLALDETVQIEIKTFIKSQQHKKGGFTDRAGIPDLYYSLFGLWLTMATEQNDLKNNLENFISSDNHIQSSGPVDDMALLLIKTELYSNLQKKSALYIIRTFLKKNRMIDLSYRFFLFSLAIDAVSKNKGPYYFFARIWMLFYSPKGAVPSSILAALLYARKTLGLNTSVLQKKLLNYSVTNSGFRSFMSTDVADTLSTGVALFVLKETDCDLRIIKPGCLEFIMENYCEGAFLSGDGDQNKDLEYTFYGLLALGSIITDNY